MPALTTDIAVAIRPARVARREDAAIAARYPGARTQEGDAARGYFDNFADAQTALEQRAALIGTERRRFTVTAQDAIDIAPDATPLPAPHLKAPDHAFDGPTLIGRIEVDLGGGITSLEVFG